MSLNLARLAGRHDLKDGLFARLQAAGRAPGGLTPAQTRALAERFLVGEATVHGASSCYDELRPEGRRRARVCNGSSCLCAGTQEALRDQLVAAVGESEVGQVTCLGRCHENHAFQLDGVNHSGAASKHLGALLAGETAGHASDSYQVAALGQSALLTAPPPSLAATQELLLRLCLERTPTDLLAELTAAGLRGRGGAGFPVASKWAACANAPGERKFIVCNADEGDPGAFSDRWLMEQRPHAILFGMSLAGQICGARDGILYVRGEYPESVAALRQAVAEWEALPWPATLPPFTFTVIQGAGAYICGEETALLASLEGRRPEVSVRPPYPTVAGLFGCPTVINNVETLAAIQAVFTLGGRAYSQLGTPQSTGTKLLSLDGGFHRPGVYEVPMGTPLTRVIEELGGGFRVAVKALHIGGPLGGLVPPSAFACLTVDHESFAAAGFLLGHGGMVTVPASLPMIDYLAHLFEFTAAESCGKCFPCRLGSQRGWELLQAAAQGRARIPRELFDDLLETMESGSLCALGGGVPLPVRHALTYFAAELAPFFTTGDAR